VRFRSGLSWFLGFAGRDSLAIGAIGLAYLAAAVNGECVTRRSSSTPLAVFALARAAGNRQRVTERAVEAREWRLRMANRMAIAALHFMGMGIQHFYSHT
jgi:hypothetical protein